MFLFFQIFLFFEKVTVFGAQHNTFMRILPMFVPDSKACQINLISKQSVGTGKQDFLQWSNVNAISQNISLTLLILVKKIKSQQIALQAVQEKRVGNQS